MNELSEAGIEVSERQLDRWVARVSLDESAVSTEKLTGAPVALERVQQDISSGWVLEQLEGGVAVHLQPFCDFILAHFNIKIALSTALLYLNEDGFTSRTLQKKSKGFTVDLEQLRSHLWKWVSSHQNQFKIIPRSKLASIDFTFTSHRTDRGSGFGIKGGAQPMESAKVSKFTGCVITCVWADGINRTPSILYTLNPDFRRDRKETARRRALLEHLDASLLRHGINEDRVIYVGKDKGEKEVYVRESPKLLRLFFEYYGVELDATILSDNGTSFFEDGESVLEYLGFKSHQTYPSDVHQYISMNDNKLHGTGKHIWRNSGVDHSDDVESCITLLKCLDQQTIKYSKHWFNKNLLELEESGVEELIANAGSKKSHLHKSWLRAYRISAGKDVRGNRPDIPEELKDRLDGFYWDSLK